MHPLWHYACGGDGLMRLNHRISSVAISRSPLSAAMAINTAVIQDESLFECPEVDAVVKVEWLAQNMTAAMQELVEDVVPIPVEVAYGPVWAGQHGDGG
jgi:hypothetical protein